MGRKSGVTLGLGALAACMWLALAAAPANAADLGPVSVPTLPPLVVAPGTVTVGPATLDPTVAVSPDGAQVGVTKDLSATVGDRGATVTLPGGQGVAIAPPSVATPAPVVSPPASNPAANSVRLPLGHTASRSVATDPAPRPVFTPIAPAATETPRVVPAPPTRVTGAIETPHAHGWSSMLAGAARSYGVLLLLLIAALALRLLVSWSWRDQRALRLACSD